MSFVRRLGGRASHGSRSAGLRSIAAAASAERRRGAIPQAGPGSGRSRETGWQPVAGAHVWLLGVMVVVMDEIECRAHDRGSAEAAANEATRMPGRLRSSLPVFCCVPANGIFVLSRPWSVGARV